jgi:hypothetical protein
VAQASFEELFYRGAHAEIVRLAIDSPKAEFPHAALPSVIGALVFLGRSEDALALYQATYPRESTPSDDHALRAQCRFYLCLAECRSGRYQGAERWCRENLVYLASAASIEPNSNASLCRFWFHQGMGLLQYFRGRIAHAMRHATRARRYAMAARFAYGRMLALDLLGHTHVQVGRVQSGLALLEQGAELAESFEYTSHVKIMRAAATDYRVRLGIADASEFDSMLKGISAEDSYSRRLLLMDIATALALRGRRTEAENALKEGAAIALPDGDQRSRVRLCLAHAMVAGLSKGESAAERWLTEAFSLLRDTDHALRIEALLNEYTVAPARFAEREAGELQRLAIETGVARAKFLTATDSQLATLEDPFLRALRRVQEGGSHFNEMVESGFLALTPRTMRLAPGRRVYLDPLANRILIEDQGEFTIRSNPPQRTLGLLDALKGGAMTKEALVQNVWRIRNYAPERHDSVVHTTVSRVRTFLDPYGAWLQATPQGYELVNVDVILLAGESSETSAIEDEVEGLTPSAAPPPMLDKQETRQGAVLRLLRNGPLSTSEIASGLKVSEMTAFRVLAELVKANKVERAGSGKNTRYSKKE